MLYQLPNGKTIRIKEEQYFQMSDAEFERMLAYAEGTAIEDPFFSSSINTTQSREQDIEDPNTVFIEPSDTEVDMELEDTD